MRSTAIHTGRNADRGAYRDERNVRCKRCGFINNLDREPRVPVNSKAGWGFTYGSEMTMDDTSATFDDLAVHMDGYYIDRETYVGGCRFCGTWLYNK